MKVLFDHCLPFALAHGGAQIQIESTMSALKAAGVEVEHLRWWDENQRGDILHYFGRLPADHIEMAHQKGLKVVMAELLTATGSRSPVQLRVQRLISAFLKKFAPTTFVAPFNWNSYRLADAVIALTPWEKHLMTYLFDASPARTFVVPNGVEDVFLSNRPIARDQWLVCTATITGRKRVLELARAAILARTPLWIIGKAYSDSDPYAREFISLASNNSRFIRFEGAISDRSRLAEIYRSARGFVLLSAMESLSLSALEAAACECPLLLSDLPWARGTFGDKASYASVRDSDEKTAAVLRQFYDAAPTLALAPKPATWPEVGRQLKQIYETILAQ